MFTVGQKALGKGRKNGREVVRKKEVRLMGTTKRVGHVNKDWWRKGKRTESERRLGHLDVLPLPLPLGLGLAITSHLSITLARKTISNVIGIVSRSTPFLLVLTIDISVYITYLTRGDISRRAT